LGFFVCRGKGNKRRRRRSSRWSRRRSRRWSRRWSRRRSGGVVVVESLGDGSTEL
jgi:hypothetical protein